MKYIDDDVWDDTIIFYCLDKYSTKRLYTKLICKSILEPYY